MQTFDRATTAFQEFIGSTRQQWANQLYPALHQHYQAQGAVSDVTDSAAAGARVADTALYQWYCFIERHYQRMKYSDPRWGLAAALEADPASTAAQLHPPVDSALLELHPELPIPEYYRAIDIHQHPGNLVGADYDGLMYQASATSIHPNTRRFEAHERFAQLLQQRGDFRSILNMGCGFGKCSFPIARTFPGAQVTGIELSAPCLRLAAHTAQSLGLTNVRFVQMDALQTGFGPGQFDLVTSTQLLHELPEAEIHQLLKESFRLLQPGGQVMHLDFRARQPWQQFLIEGHAVRNNEGFLTAFNRMDIEAAYTAAGFTDVKVEPFAETPGSTSADWPYWRFPWTLFSARRPLDAVS